MSKFCHPPRPTHFPRFIPTNHLHLSCQLAFFSPLPASFHHPSKPVRRSLSRAPSPSRCCLCCCCYGGTPLAHTATTPNSHTSQVSSSLICISHATQLPIVLPRLLRATPSAPVTRYSALLTRVVFFSTTPHFERATLLRHQSFPTFPSCKHRV